MKAAGAHLIGSVPLPDAETVFRTAAGALGPHLRRLPDGETGERRRWIWFQRQMLERHLRAELARLGDAAPSDVEMGYHLCYGSPADEHLVMPRDMAIMIEMANGARQALTRRIDFLHMPVPKDRADAAYFKPLIGLTGFADTMLYLGLIHHDDRAGDLARIHAAREFVATFGVASECGWGRTDPQRVSGLLESHRLAVKEMS